MTNHHTQGKVTVGMVLLLGVLAALAVMFVMNMSKEDDAKNIRSVLEQNQQFGDILASRIGERAENPTDADLDRVAGYYDEYVSQMRKIDMHAAPRDFAEAFYRYTAAFEDQAQVMHAHPHVPSDDQAVAASLEGVLQGDPGKASREFKAALEAWNSRRQEKADAASRAEQEMKAVATRYGAL